MKQYKVDVKVVYTGTVLVEAESVSDAKKSISQWPKVQGVINDSMVDENDDYEFCMNPDVEFGRFKRHDGKRLPDD